jgi:competence protein ComEC
LKVNAVQLGGGNNVFRSGCGKVKVFCRGALSGFNEGDVIRAQGNLAPFDELSNPGGFSLGSYNFEQGIYRNFFARSSDIQLIKKDRPGFFTDLIFSLQQQIKSRIYFFMPGYRDLLGSMLVGSSVAGLTPKMQDKYKKAGLSHLLVASGMQISIIVGSVAVLLANFKFSPKGTFLVLSGLNVFCFLLTGAGTSITRACLMFEFVLLAKLLGRAGNFLTSLWLAAVIIALFSPLALFSPSFLLSFAATIGVTSFAPFLAKGGFYDFIRRGGAVMVFPRWLSEMLSASLAPLLLTYPICIYFFHQASTVAFLANLVVLPAISFITIFAAVTLVLSFLALPLAKVLGLALYGALFLLDHFVSFAASLPGSTVNIHYISVFVAGLVYLAMFAILKIVQKFGRRIALLTCGLLLISFFLLSAFSGQSELVIRFLDVGQGDAILLQTPSGKNILVDAGDKGMGRSVVVPVLRNFGINRLDLVILTHPHADHFGGMDEVIEGIQVDAFGESPLGVHDGEVSRGARDGPQPNSSQSYQYLLNLVAARHIRHLFFKSGDHFSCGEINFYILGPPPEGIQSESSLNDNSIVMKIVYGKYAFLLTGDAEKSAEQYLLSLPLNLHSQILKVGHHGSRTASSPEFLAAVRPKIAVISCGRRNKFRHPHKITLNNLAGAGMRVLRTDVHGAIVLATDGERVSVKTMRLGGRSTY